MDVNALVVEAKGGIGKKSGRQWYMAVISLNGNLLRLFSDVDMKAYVGQECTLKLKISGQQDLTPSISIVSVE